MAHIQKRARAQLEVTLPDHLVEKIVAMMPFPALLTARGLSRYWYRSFTAIPPESSSLQDQVRSVSSKWRTFCPTFVNQDNQLIGYDSSIDQWSCLLSLSYFPLQSSICKFVGFSISLEGPLLCSSVNPNTCTCCSAYETYFKSELYITNVITKDWKYLPPRPNMQHPTHVQVLPSKTGGYKILTVTHPVTSTFGEGGSDLLQIYDSKQDAWNVIRTESTSSYLDDLGGVLLNEKYYVLYRNEEIISRTAVKEHIMVYDTKDGSCTKVALDLLPLRPNVEAYDFGIVKARGSIMLVVVGEAPYEDEFEHRRVSDPCELTVRSISPNSIMVFELKELSNWTFKCIEVGPPCFVRNVSIEQIIGHNNRIYLSGCVKHSSVIFCDLQRQQWGILGRPRAGTCSLSTVAHCFEFEPGLDPFMPI